MQSSSVINMLPSDHSLGDVHVHQNTMNGLQLQQEETSFDVTDDAILDLIHNTGISKATANANANASANANANANAKSTKSSSAHSEPTHTSETIPASPGSYFDDKSRNSRSSIGHGNIHTQGYTNAMFKSEVNHFNLSPKIRMNPRDAMSPRRSRMVSKRKEYESTSSSTRNTSANTPMPIAESYANANANANAQSASSDSWKETEARSVKSYASGMSASQASASASASASQASASLHSTSVGGLQYIENISLSSTPSRNHPHQHQHKNQNQNQQHQQYQYQHPGSVGSRSTARSSTSRNSKAKMIQAPNKRNQGLALGQEQVLFEQRLCDVNYGVAVRKIHSNGKSQLRHVKCIPFRNKDIKSGAGGKKQNMSFSVPDTPSAKKNASSSRSVTSLMGRIGRRSKASSVTAGNGNGHVNGNATVNTASEETYPQTEKQAQKQSMALTWGNKKKVIIPLYKFTAVRKGKTTSRTMRNSCHPSKLLSLVTSDKRHGSLDIEAPTKLDRDKFALAFASFLDVPLKDDFVGESVNIAQDHDNDNGDSYSEQGSHLMGDDLSSLPSTSTASSMMTPHGVEEYHIAGALLPSLTSSPSSSGVGSSKLIMESKGIINDGPSLGYSRASGSLNSVESLNALLPTLDDEDDDDDAKDTTMVEQMKDAAKPASETAKNDEKNDTDDNDALSAVSSLTQGFDQEIVEELHMALNELRAELETSRAEAARAVKVAEQAIQSAESCSSNDWNSTVTHKAAEAAAQAQKRSAEAIAKQRLAEEKLAAERKSASFWRKQAQTVEDEAGGLQTRLAVAQVQRVTVTEELDREKRKAASYIQTMKRDYSMQESIQRETVSSAAEQNRLLEYELDGTRRDLIVKSEEAKTLADEIANL